MIYVIALRLSCKFHLKRQSMPKRVDWVSLNNVLAIAPLFALAVALGLFLEPY